ncbi:hypothetical protein NA57DRAFT_54513 [Rhizodiscina lignyota]|uniref:Mitotic checkpoint regulator, MAD2B-interacting-domain-containing protein n=1 Tax=Rhizodiscina lignyota TaxID=1504668 RepID=A0A9P4IG92_9PEZI|nr:hypothetical protein NA57DRAFT_54513 [Rhizodiscina lignyota]
MNLVAYSDSEDSDAEPSKPTPAPAPAAKPAPKASAQKIVDRANPGKIRVNLPTATASEDSKDNVSGDAPPAKRARTGGAFGGFNAMLPAPKKTAESAKGSGGGVNRGLGRGVHFKTSAQAAFSREPVEFTPVDRSEPEGGMGNGDGVKGFPQEKKEEEVKLIGKPTVFKPLSVVNKQKKKKRTAAEVAADTTNSMKPSSTTADKKSSTTAQPPAPAPKPKVSLFSLQQDDGPIVLPPEPQEADAVDEAADDPSPDDGTTTQSLQYPVSADTNAPSNSLNVIAADMKLTAAERRQLFGRNASKNAPEAVNVVNFNTDAEYAANEAARASGELAAQAQQNMGVRAIAPGKHSLKQLMNAATSQKDVLEDSFAQGKRNKKEAGNKYGWS